MPNKTLVTSNTELPAPKRPRKRAISSLESHTTETNVPKRTRRPSDTTAKRSDRPLDVLAEHIVAWQDGETDQPVSDHESDSGMDWKKPDVISDNVSIARGDRRLYEQARTQREARDYYNLDTRLASLVGKCPICYTRHTAGREVGVYHTIEDCKDESRALVVTGIARLRDVKFEKALCCESCSVPREMCQESRYLSSQFGRGCPYKGIVHEAVVAIMIVGPDAVVQKMYSWMRDEGVWTENAPSGGEQGQRVSDMMMEWFSKKASWRNYTASVLVQVFNQLNGWLEAFKQGKELEDWLRAD
jgi:hypothetical protein